MNPPGRQRLGAALCLCLLTMGCQQEMARQPSYRPLERTDFFDDGRASRPLAEGTVRWRAGAADESEVQTYRREPGHDDAARALALLGNPNVTALALLPLAAEPPGAEYVDVCPIPMDRAALERGRDRFNIYCAVCHDALGTGNGKIVERGYLPPPDYHRDYSRGFERRGRKVWLRDVPIGYLYEVVTRGYGGMPDYASQIPPDDRWKIVAYVRVLQRSQWVKLAELPAGRRQAIEGKLPPAEERK